ncbi:PaaX family transcriptional regulator C-terminal domain-containing protein [Arthrobacter sp. GMC3]|uniref:PaaX family transcriptional regulator n=1 Tax=Arthrobacter sp. GMC3 TaxID=2058894 RepID=UPI0021589148|nr:PaaX family transcriptional regulator C-terminal domain-containing protein [Arthrobacter sp. GMC3]
MTEPAIRHHQLIITLYGLYCRGAGQAMPVSVLIDMLGDLGYDHSGVRSAVSRLKAKGVLKSVKDGNVAKYELSSTVADLFLEGDERIFSAEPTNATDGWVLAIFSVPEALRNRRHQLRTVLSGFGFGSMTSGVWVAPASALERTKERLRTLRLDQFVDFFKGDHVADGDLPAKVAQWWHLASLDEQFAEFLDLYAGDVVKWTAKVGADPQRAVAESTAELRRDAFRCYIPMLTIWRRFPYKDPGLAPEYLPKDWKGQEARATFLEIHRLLAPLAAAHARALMT